MAEQAQTTVERAQRRERIGRVVSNKMQKKYNRCCRSSGEAPDLW